MCLILKRYICQADNTGNEQLPMKWMNEWSEWSRTECNGISRLRIGYCCLWRDRKRFRLFLERKKQERARKTASALRKTVSTIVSPNPDSREDTDSNPDSDVSHETVADPNTPSPDSKVDSVPVTVQSSTYLDPKSTPDSPEKQTSCECGICSPEIIVVLNFNPTDLILECGYCKVPASQAPQGLKPCARCLSMSYCSRTCQSKDWKEGEHGQFCSEDKAVHVRLMHQNALERKEKALQILQAHS